MLRREPGKPTHTYQRGRCPCCNSSIRHIWESGREDPHIERLRAMMSAGVRFVPPLCVASAEEVFDEPQSTW